MENVRRVSTICDPSTKEVELNRFLGFTATVTSLHKLASSRSVKRLKKSLAKWVAAGELTEFWSLTSIRMHTREHVLLHIGPQSPKTDLPRWLEETFPDWHHWQEWFSVHANCYIEKRKKTKYGLGDLEIEMSQRSRRWQVLDQGKDRLTAGQVQTPYLLPVKSLLVGRWSSLWGL